MSACRVCATLLSCCLVSLLSLRCCAEERPGSSFREILQLSGVSFTDLSQLGEASKFVDADWQLVFQVFNRWQQFHREQSTLPRDTAVPASWSAKPDDCLGEAYELEGFVEAVESVSLLDRWSKQFGQQSLYRCRFQFLDASDSQQADVTVLTTQIPKRWQTRESFHDKVRIRGVLLSLREHGESLRPLLITNHLAWFPLKNAPTGQLLLARHGMDTALLDEVMHSRSFVKPEVSSEGEAFYAALIALGQADPAELARLAKENVLHAASLWKQKQPELRRQHQTLQNELANETEQAAQAAKQREIKRVKKERGLAAAVLQQAESGLSSVAPMFLHPEDEVGELYAFEGMARRAVRIDVQEQSELKEYFEIEVFTLDSQNLPIVCCMYQLPAGFPVGDQIREPVRISGVFFKKWRYRSRKNVALTGETNAPRQLYTPVLIGKQPIWLKKPAGSNDGGWALWGGIAFLVVLAVLWTCMAWLARRDKLTRASMRPQETIDI